MIAHPHTQQQLKRYLDAPAQALGLSGGQGAGKGFVAAHVAQKIVGDRSPYILIIDAHTTKTGIDDIRQLQKFLTLTVPGQSRFKRAVIIEHIDALGHEAQNALLKTLEEPPTDTVIVVTYSRDTAILPTIHSRLQHITVLPIGRDEGISQFNTYPEPEYTRAFHMSNGNIGLLVALLENQESHPLLQGISQAKELLGMSRYQRLAGTDKIIKNTAIQPAIVLDGLYRLVNATYQQSVGKKANQELQIITARLKHIERAISDLDANVQAKLVFSRLFLEL